MPNTLASDFLIIGSGIAGLSLALKASEFGTVRLVTKRALSDSATDYAQGGLAAVFAEGDSFDAHVQDTLDAGGGLCDEAVVRRVVAEAPARIDDLVRWGVRFSADAPRATAGQRFELGLEGGHSRRRILHVGDYTGHAVEQALVERARENPRITIHEHHFAVDLITRRRLGRSGPDACAGAYVLDVEPGAVRTFLARATALATGGAGKVYLYTSNPDIATGDGMAMAHRAGALLANLEFVQFHPTCLFHPKAKNFLITEALRGEGGVLKNRAGERFVKKADPRGELAPRDIVARAIDEELKRTGEDCVFLDITSRGAEFLRRRFPKIHERCLSFGIDITTQPIPVVPAAHYFCGGVWTDLHGTTTIPRLSAVGEVACTGLHGANRLASNSLPEALVFAHAVARHWEGLKTAEAPLAAEDVPPWNPGQARNPDEQVVIRQVWEEVRRFMWNYVGIARTTKRLERAQRRIASLQKEIHEYYWDFLLTPDLLELRNIAVVADLVIRCGLARKESRGLHFTADAPRTDPALAGKPTFIEGARTFLGPAPAGTGR
ncbi:MAG: L-aspartate oxidase [Elusimicrobia bacterium]|jgi:L-aspartate oxidase|nr:L-aspartate oxidase [Elusimicrobiota bacterium]MBK9430648.1 L-aspartate oxidase [Elusimicrobiota bacterium]